MIHSVLADIILSSIHYSKEEKIVLNDMKKHTGQEDVFKKLQDEKYSAIMQTFNNKLLELANENCPTSKMWVEYFQMTTLLKKFIEASHCGFLNNTYNALFKCSQFFMSGDTICTQKLHTYMPKK